MWERGGEREITGESRGHCQGITLPLHALLHMLVCYSALLPLLFFCWLLHVFCLCVLCWLVNGSVCARVCFCIFTSSCFDFSLHFFCACFSYFRTCMFLYAFGLPSGFISGQQYLPFLARPPPFESTFATPPKTKQNKKYGKPESYRYNLCACNMATLPCECKHTQEKLLSRSEELFLCVCVCEAQRSIHKMPLPRSEMAIAGKRGESISPVETKNSWAKTQGIAMWESESLRCPSWQCLKRRSAAFSPRK